MTYKAVIIGNGSVGKSCLIVRFKDGRFLQDYDPTIEENYKKEFTVDGEDVVMEITDTAGQEEFRSVRDKYIKIGESFIVVFSIISRSSFTEARNLHEAIRRAKNFKRVPVVTVANKIDLEEERLVSKEEGEELAAKYNSVYIETSAKTGLNVDSVFVELVRLGRKIKLEAEKADEGAKEVKEPAKESNNAEGGCCSIF